MNALRTAPDRPPVLGIVGGGQLARMLAQAAGTLGVRTHVLDRVAAPPAATVATRQVVGDWNHPADLLAFAGPTDVVTIEHEFVEAGALAVLERQGFSVCPGADVLARVQDKLRQREILAAAGLPVPAFRSVEDVPGAAQAGQALGWPLLLKRRRGGYDGKGNATVRDPAGLAAAWQALGGAPDTIYAEAFCAFERELAVMVCRDRQGQTVSYPVAETIQRDHICTVVTVPAPISAELAAQAAELARRALATVGGVGTFGVELFLGPGDQLTINELAPRVHNSGHYTIEACACSQFENHVRAVLGWPLGSAALRAPAAAMVNLLGVGPGPGWPAGLGDALEIPGAHVHLYGKESSGPGRKMGHVTALGPTPAEALAMARRAARALRFGIPT